MFTVWISGNSTRSIAPSRPSWPPYLSITAIIGIAVGRLDERNPHHVAVAPRRLAGRGLDRLAGHVRRPKPSAGRELNFQKLFEAVVDAIQLRAAVGAVGIDDQHGLGQPNPGSRRFHRRAILGVQRQQRLRGAGPHEIGLRQAAA